MKRQTVLINVAKMQATTPKGNLKEMVSESTGEG